MFYPCSKLPDVFQSILKEALAKSGNGFLFAENIADKEYLMADTVKVVEITNCSINDILSRLEKTTPQSVQELNQE